MQRIVPLLVSTIIAVATLLPQGMAKAGDTNTSLRVMTFNIRYGTAQDGTNSWPHRDALVVQTICDFNPDLLGLQEVLESQAEFLKENLPHYAFHGVGRDDGDRKGEYAPIMFRRDRFEQIDAGHFWLSPDPEVPGSLGWDAALPRICSWVRLKDKSHTQGQLLYLNTHFDHRGPQARLESARLIARQIQELRQEGDAVILTGDFNCSDDDPPYKSLVPGPGDSASGLVDSFRETHPQKAAGEGTFHGWEGGTSGKRIDWILHSDQLKALSAEINHNSEGGRLPSDHYPVQVVLDYR